MAKFSNVPSEISLPSGWLNRPSTVHDLYVRNVPINPLRRREFMTNIITEWYAKNAPFARLIGWQEQYKDAYSCYQSMNNILNHANGLNVKCEPKIILWWHPSMPDYFVIYRDGATDPVQRVGPIATIEDEPIVEKKWASNEWYPNG